MMIRLHTRTMGNHLTCNSLMIRLQQGGLLVEADQNILLISKAITMITFLPLIPSISIFTVSKNILKFMLLNYPAG